MDGLLNRLFIRDRDNPQGLTANYKRQIWLTVAICLFLVLDCSILGINFYITVQVEKDAQAINVSGRQRMLSQRLTKVLLILDRNPEARAESMAELKHVYDLFSSTLYAFDKGGWITGGGGSQYRFEAIDDELAKQYIRDTKYHFASIAGPVSQLLENGYVESIQYQALAAAQENNLKILKLMNDLTSRMEQLSKQKTASLRWFQTIAFFFAFINFVVIVMIYHKRSSEAERQVGSFLSLVNSAATAIIVMDASRKIVMANEMAQDMFGYDERHFHKIKERKLFKYEKDNCFAVMADGTELRVQIIEKSFSIHDSEFIILTVNDISTYTDEQERLAFLANHDALTGLVNRRALFDRLDLEVLHAKRSGNMLAVLFLDLDGFKPVNDQYGHLAGDDLLKQVAHRIRENVREADTVSRYGGDEFVVLITGITDSAFLAKCKEQLDRAFEKPFLTNGQEIKLGFSSGMSCYPDDALGSGELIEIADNRMYQMKSLSR
jgi:diguanylate cyclase (GGDEF)-like protein